jgi:hypothetical protein
MLELKLEDVICDRRHFAVQVKAREDAHVVAIAVITQRETQRAPRLGEIGATTVEGILDAFPSGPSVPKGKARILTKLAERVESRALDARRRAQLDSVVPKHETLHPAVA